MKDTIDKLEKLEFKPLPELEDKSVVDDGLGLSSGYSLLSDYDKLIDLGIRCWQYHFEFLNLGYAAYVSFLDSARSNSPISRHSGSRKWCRGSTSSCTGPTMS